MYEPTLRKQRQVYKNNLLSSVYEDLDLLMITYMIHISLFSVFDALGSHLQQAVWNPQQYTPMKRRLLIYLLTTTTNQVYNIAMMSIFKNYYVVSSLLHIVLLTIIKMQIVK